MSKKLGGSRRGSLWSVDTSEDLGLRRRSAAWSWRFPTLCWGDPRERLPAVLPPAFLCGMDVDWPLAPGRCSVRRWMFAAARLATSWSSCETCMRQSTTCGTLSMLSASWAPMARSALPAGPCSIMAFTSVSSFLCRTAGRFRPGALALGVFRDGPGAPGLDLSKSRCSAGLSARARGAANLNSTQSARS